MLLIRSEVSKIIVNHTLAGSDKDIQYALYISRTAADPLKQHFQTK